MDFVSLNLSVQKQLCISKGLKIHKCGFYILILKFIKQKYKSTLKVHICFAMSYGYGKWKRNGAEVY